MSLCVDFVNIAVWRPKKQYPHTKSVVTWA